MNKQIGIIGEFHHSRTQTSIASSIEHCNKKLGTNTSFQWIDTTSLDKSNFELLLKDFDGIWSAPGSPFKSLEGALNAIKFARENKIPHLGTCGGYQHSIIEYARNVLGFVNAKHEEYSDEKDELFVNRMSCSLVGTKGMVRIIENTLARKITVRNEIEVEYFCSFGLNEKYQSVLLDSNLVASGFDSNNMVRILELKNHPFFIITAFVPQVDSTDEKPNPFVMEFMKKINEI